MIIARDPMVGFGLQRRRTLSTFSKSNTLDHAGQVERQLCSRLFIKFCHKNGDIFFDFPEIVMRDVVNGDCYQNFMHAKREVWEKSVARDWPTTRIQKKFKILKKLKNLKKIQGILIRNNAFVAWAWCRWLLQVMVVHNTWLVQTSNTILIVVQWANRGPTKVRIMCAGTITFFGVFRR